MSGHSKWATTKHRKAAQDAKRSALFSKLSRNITVAAKEGGDPNPDNNASLAAAIEKAKGYSLPKDKIKTAIDKAFGSGTGRRELRGPSCTRATAPAGVGHPLSSALTDNRNRTAADVRSRLHPCGRQPGHLRFRCLHVRAQGPDHGPQGDRDGRQEASHGLRTAPLPMRKSSRWPSSRPARDDYEDADEEWIVYTQPSDLMAVKKRPGRAGRRRSRAPR